MGLEKTLIKEIWRGTRGGSYFYVVEGKELVHISNYATKKLPSKYEDEVVYEVPTDRVIGKTIYHFSFSKSGNILPYKCRIEDFVNGYPKTYEYFEIHELRGLRFRVTDHKLKFLLTQFEQVFVPMIHEIEEYQRLKGFEISLMGRSRRLMEAFSDPELYYYTFMSLPNDKSRLMSLRVIRRWIYQIWTLKLTCEALKASKFKGHEYEGRPYWWVEQGSDMCTGIMETPFGDVTFWLEFQPGSGAHMIGMFVERRVPIRPDIVLVKGYFEWTRDFVESGKAIDVIIECKEDPFDKWEGEIESQIIPYQKIFKPHNFIVVSLERVPETVKESLRRQGIDVVDDLKPNSESIKEFTTSIVKAFESLDQR